MNHHGRKPHPSTYRVPFNDSNSRWQQQSHDIRQRRDIRWHRHEEGRPPQSRAPFQPPQHSRPMQPHQEGAHGGPSLQPHGNNQPLSHHRSEQVGNNQAYSHRSPEVIRSQSPSYRSQSSKPPFQPPQNSNSPRESIKAWVRSADSTPQSPVPTIPSNPPATNDDLRETPRATPWNSHNEDLQKKVNELKIRVKEIESKCRN